MASAAKQQPIASDSANPNKVWLPTGVSHQLRTPLNAIIGFTGTLLMKLPGPITKAQEEQLQIIQDNARELLSMIDRLLRIATAQPGTPWSGTARQLGNKESAAARERGTPGARILVIEDHAANRKLLAYLLTAYGYEPLMAEDGEQGLVIARREMPDLILCDLQLPTIDGYEVARQLKDEPCMREIPLVAMTALAAIDNAEKLLAAGFDHSVIKPIDPETFQAQLEALLAQRVQ